MSFLTILGIIVSSFFSVWAIMKYIIAKNVRLDDNISKNLIIKIKKDSKFKFELKNELSLNRRFPLNYKTLSYVDGLFIFFSREERLLSAGWQSRDIVSEAYYLRWQKKKVEKFIIDTATSATKISVMALTPWGSDKLGEISTIEEPEIFLNEESYKDIEDDIIDMLNNNKEKTSCLLSGNPGGGKTRLIKYISQKYKLPIYSIFLNPEYSNLDILAMFNDIPEKCIVLFEDFDNYFDKRECIIKHDKINFTFDVILNILDGVYNEYKQVFFAMTCNDIEKVDISLKERPSRFKHVKMIGLPDYVARLKVLKNDELAELTEGMTLDKVFYIKSFIENYKHEDIIDRIYKIKNKVIENV